MLVLVSTSEIAQDEKTSFALGLLIPVIFMEGLSASYIGLIFKEQLAYALAVVVSTAFWEGCFLVVH